MSNERRHQDDLSDPLVSRTYRDLSNERTPEHLDHIVLNEARTAAKPGYVRNISWLRPAAWVTTIGLCLAIVLEVSDLAPPAQSLPDAPAKVVKESEDSVMAVPATGGMAAPAARAKSSDAPRSDSVRTEKQEVFSEAEQGRPDVGVGRFELKTLEEVPATTAEPVSTKRQGPAVVEIDSFDQDDGQLLRDAEDRARLQTGSDQESVESLLQVAPALGMASDAAAERYCEDSETSDPNAWLACILELEQQGLLEAAKLERDLLRESFPDAHVPNLIGPLNDPR